MYRKVLCHAANEGDFGNSAAAAFLGMRQVRSIVSGLQEQLWHVGSQGRAGFETSAPLLAIFMNRR